MSVVRRGAEVMHPRWHRGIVVDTRHKGFEVLVRFGRDSQWVRATELSTTAREKRPVQEIARVRTARLARERVDNPQKIQDLRALFEAFRLGIVPHGAIVDWTFGRDREVEAIKAWLGDQGYGSLVLEGAYGTGKTHLLEVLYAKAIEMGYAVTRIGFDPSEAPAAFPKRVYRRAIRALRVPIDGRVVGFREALREAALRGDELLEGHPFLGDAMARVRAGTITDPQWEELEGRDSGAGLTTGLYDYTTSANIYCNILSGLGNLFVRGLGTLGFLLLLDEVETAQTWLYHYHWRRGLNFFQGLSLTANDHPELLDEVVEKRKTAHRGAETGLVYSGHNPVPYLWSLPSYLKVVFAITPGAFTKRFLDWHPEQPIVTLSSLPADSLGALFERLADAYELVHGATLDRKGRDMLRSVAQRRSQDGTTRVTIKAMIEGLDFVRFHPGRPYSELVEDDAW